MAHNLHDQSYRKLFSSPHMVRALFEGILPARLHELIDLETLKPLSSSFISTKHRDRHSDCIWQVRYLILDEGLLVTLKRSLPENPRLNPCFRIPPVQQPVHRFIGGGKPHGSSHHHH